MEPTGLHPLYMLVWVMVITVRSFVYTPLAPLIVRLEALSGRVAV